MLLVTGGAGFIGSNLVAGLNEAGRTDIVVNDALGDKGKWRNLGKRQLADVVPPGELMGWLDGRKLDAILHLGAISDTTATDGDLVLDTNFRLALKLLDWCTATRTPFIYASSAATYGDRAEGFDDDWSPAALRRLKPMNLYGFSKLCSISPWSNVLPKARSCHRNGRALNSSTFSDLTNITRAR